MMVWAMAEATCEVAMILCLNSYKRARAMHLLSSALHLIQEGHREQWQLCASGLKYDHLKMRRSLRSDDDVTHTCLQTSQCFPQTVACKGRELVNVKISKHPITTSKEIAE